MSPMRCAPAGVGTQGFMNYCCNGGDHIVENSDVSLQPNVPGNEGRQCAMCTKIVVPDFVALLYSRSVPFWV
jgi:hypothetical protein